ncbi:hypothetical protein ACLH26_22225, partial [Bacillus subtilis]
MRRFILVISLLAAAAVAYPIQVKASTMPCSVIMEPVDQSLRNVKGVALIYKVQL